MYDGCLNGWMNGWMVAWLYMTAHRWDVRDVMAVVGGVAASVVSI